MFQRSYQDISLFFSTIHPRFFEISLFTQSWVSTLEFSKTFLRSSKSKYKTEYKTIILFVKQCVNVNQLVYMYKYGFYVNFRNKKTALFLRNHYSYFTWDISLPLQIAMIKRIPWYPISSIEMTESPQQSPSQPPADPKKEFPDIVRSLVIFR